MTALPPRGSVPACLASALPCGALLASVLLAAALLLTGCGTGAPAGTAEAAGASGVPVRQHAATAVHVWVPSSLTDLAPQLAAAYARDTGDTHPIVLNLASSAQLVQQANRGEEPDVLITADTPALDALQRPGDYARGKDVAANALVLAVPADSPISTPAQLGEANVVAMCAPSVPCGRAAHAYLQSAGLALDTVSEEDNVRAVLTKVGSGQVDAGFVYATDAAAAGGAVRAMALPGLEPNSYPLLVSRDAPESARDFAAWLGGDEAARLFEAAGFQRP